MASSIIGLTGYARSGKDSAAAVLVKEYGYTRVAFADGVRSMALAIDPLLFGNVRLSSVVRTSGWDEAKAVPEVRRLLQAIGTEGVRNHIGDDSWVRVGKRKVDAVDGPVVITDVRFPNEAAAVREWGGFLLRMSRLNSDGSEYNNGLGRDHPSEATIADLPVDGTLHASSVGELEHAVRVMVNSRALVLGRSSAGVR
jgi:hypothetical protein